MCRSKKRTHVFLRLGSSQTCSSCPFLHFASINSDVIHGLYRVILFIQVSDIVLGSLAYLIRLWDYHVRVVESNETEMEEWSLKDFNEYTAFKRSQLSRVVEVGKLTWIFMEWPKNFVDEGQICFSITEI